MKEGRRKHEGSWKTEGRKIEMKADKDWKDKKKERREEKKKGKKSGREKRKKECC